MELIYENGDSGSLLDQANTADDRKLELIYENGSSGSLLNQALTADDCKHGEIEDDILS